MTTYKGYLIAPTPTYAREFRWQFTHKEYTGPEDRRHGFGKTLEECTEQIDVLTEATQ